MFEDRRAKGNRRTHYDPEAVPAQGCRRNSDRRDFFRRYEALPWWLQTNYVEEVQPPLLDSDAPAHGAGTHPEGRYRDFQRVKR